MYGTQAISITVYIVQMFENDVKMYGTQARHNHTTVDAPFENDVKMYGTQATRLLFDEFQ